MNEHEPEADPGQEQAVRALLGEVGAQHEPIPDEVSARLDDTLAMLRAERVEALAQDEQATPGEGDRTNVVPLRRKWLPRAAGAAAAVIVLGVGGLAAVRLGTDGSSKDSAASGGVAGDTAPSSQAPSEAPVPSAGAVATPGSKARALRESAGAVRALPAVTTATFAGDVDRPPAHRLRADHSCRTRGRPVRGRVGLRIGLRIGLDVRATRGGPAAPGRVQARSRVSGSRGQRRSRGQPGAPRRDALRAAGPPGEGRRAAGRGVDL